MYYDTVSQIGYFKRYNKDKDTRIHLGVFPIKSVNLTAHTI